MLGREEAVSCGDGVDPVAEVAFVDLDDSVAAIAEQVMVVRVGAEPVAVLVPVVRQDVDHAVVDEQGEGAVDGGDPDEVVPAVAKTLPELLGRRIVRLARELGEHGDPLGGRPHALALEKLGELGLRCPGHGL